MDKLKLKRLLVGDFTLRRLIRSVFSIVVLVCLGMSLYAYFYAEKIIFQPQPSSYRDTDRIIKFSSGDGAAISAVYLPNPDARYTLLYSHGNAEDVGQLLPILEEIKGLGFSVLAYDYHGYGTSSGTPSEENAYRDADAAYDYLVKEQGVPAHDVIALGRSLGGAVAVDLASRRQLGGLIIESSFVTAYRVITHIPVLPFDKFQSLSKIKRVRCPVLVIHGKKDNVIPFWHGEKLFEEANEPKRSLWVEGAGHNNVFEASGNRYGQALRDFVALIERGG
ncbi:MAG: alpha/beta hydrolase [Acidobacteria bacterium]|nr:alpha/beta hydrolase [Acidobacteriota bacterium]